MSLPDAITVVHLSDLHFGKYMRSFQTNPGDGDTGESFPVIPSGELPDPITLSSWPKDLKKRLEDEADGMATSIAEDLVGLAKRQVENGIVCDKRIWPFKIKPDLVMVTGDITDTGTREQFALAERFFVKLESSLGLSRERIILIPGNHDFHHDNSRSYFYGFHAEYGRYPSPPYWGKYKFYSEFFDRFYKTKTPYRFTEICPWTLFYIDEPIKNSKEVLHCSTSMSQSRTQRRFCV